MNIIEVIKKNNILKIVLILVAVYFFMRFYQRETLENVGTIQVPLVQPMVVQPQLDLPVHMKKRESEHLFELNEEVVDHTKHTQQQQIEKIVAGPTQLTTTDLLPKYDAANEFAKENPVGKLLQEKSFLQAGYHMGINTVMQSNKIPYLDIRSVPPIPKTTVGPFMNSSYEQPVGSGRKFFEIGQ